MCDAAIKKMVEGLGEIHELTVAGSDDAGVALHELDSRSIILWGTVLERFLRRYLDSFPLSDLELDEEELEERFKVAFDERTQPLTRHLLKTALRGEPPLTLAQLAARRYNPNTSSFRKLQRHLLRAIVCPMRDLCLWQLDVQQRTLKNGKKAIAKYGISAGPALLAFHKHVYVPLRISQIQTFCEKHNIQAR
jgi:hypothetical protein